MKNKILLLAIFLFACGSAWSQVDLMNKVVNNQSDHAKEGFQFTTVVNANATLVENQANSGTCWSYSTNSFLESEMIRNGGPAIHLSPIYSARCAYMQKAIDYVRMHGALCWDDGGEEHDVINMYAKYGAIPEADYTGLDYGTKQNDFPEMMAVLKSILDAIIKAPNQGTLTTGWSSAINGVLNAYLGKVPKTFQYEGKTYTPESFAKEVVKLNPDNYVEFISQTNTPYWKKAPMMFPDNWEMQSDWNIPMDNISKIIDYALEHHYTVAWGTDISEPYFSWQNGIAYVPAVQVANMTPEQRAAMFDGPKPEMAITPEMRQEGMDDYQTTDDHGMQITGIAKDQNGKEWYMVKNSWGTHNDYKGYLYVTKDYVDYKTTSFMVNKNGIPEDIRQKLGI